MSKLYEALQNAQMRSAELRPAPTARALANDPQTLRLFQSIERSLGDGPKVVQVTACGTGEGASTVAGRLARLAAGPMGRRCLLVDASTAPRGPRPQLPAAAEKAGGQLPGADVVRLADAADPLTVSTLAEQLGEVTHLPSLDQVRALWDRLRSHYDLIVVDTPPASTTSALAMAPTADGVVLVVEAEGTPIATAQSIRNSLVDGGANLLGVVFNKRRTYVPKLLDKWL